MLVSNAAAMAQAIGVLRVLRALRRRDADFAQVAAQRIEERRALADQLDAGFVEKVSAELTPGKAAVVADVAEDGVPSFAAQMRSIGGAVVRK